MSTNVHEHSQTRLCFVPLSLLMIHLLHLSSSLLYLRLFLSITEVYAVFIFSSHSRRSHCRKGNVMLCFLLRSERAYAQILRRIYVYIYTLNLMFFIIRTGNVIVFLMMVCLLSAAAAAATVYSSIMLLYAFFSLLLQHLSTL
jgi:hypothetical protein